jgi:hypothetical protein
MAKVEADFDKAAQASKVERAGGGLEPEPKSPAGSSSADRTAAALEQIKDYARPPFGLEGDR